MQQTKGGRNQRKSVQKNGMGVRGKLLVSFALVGLMAVIAAAVGAVSFERFGTQLDNITEAKLPPMFSAQQLATESAEIVAIAPRIVAASTPDEEAAVKAELDNRIVSLKQRVEQLRQSGMQPDTLDVIETNTTQLQDTLAKLHELVQKRFQIADEKAQKLTEFQQLSDRFVSTLKPLMTVTSNELNQISEMVKELRKSPVAQTRQPREDLIASLFKYHDSVSKRAPLVNLTNLGNQISNIVIGSASERDMTRLSIVGVRVRGSYADATNMLRELGNPKLIKFYEDLIDKMQKLSVGDGSLPDLQARQLQTAIDAQALVSQAGEYASTMGFSVDQVVETLQSDVDGAATNARDLQQQGSLVLYIVAAIAVLLSLAIYVIYVRGNLLRRLGGLQQTMVKLADGNLDVVVPAKGNDEISAMGRAVEVFKDNAVKVRAMQAEEERLNRERNEALRDELLGLADTLQGEVESAVGEIAALAEQLQGVSGQMTQSAELVSGQSDEVASSAREATSNVETVAAATEQLAASNAEINRQMAESTRISNEAAEKARETNELVNSLSLSANRIGEVIALITDIAEQTNLLALNATIEAARAGDAGKGFAVVAAEVKNLANQTEKATDEIAGQISGIQKSTGESVSAIEMIGAIIESINEIATTISAAVEEQGAATNEITRNVRNAAERTRMVSTSISDVADETGKTGELSGEVLQTSQDAAQKIQVLNNRINTILDDLRRKAHDRAAS
ncbi:chemotaxis protein [Thalassospira marina]|uniref:Chemotaxis protein n=2 Tax=Thalassospira marina TaxID=2048283 RepID=A0A2N3KS77_9PROT|nr:chemotaxis protein [Thalassospira marina]PKR53414.1 chemotaxis protein [Thalassospira marina]